MQINDLDVAINAAISASEIIAESYGNFKQLDFKSDIDVVTEVDFKCEEAISNILREETPDYGIIAEEGTSFPGEKVWIVDPLDGTKEFIEGVPQFVVSVALVENGVPIVGVLHNPVTKETFHASQGNGTYFDDAIHSCSVKDSTTDMVILNSRSETRRGLWEPYKKHFKELKPIGSVAYKMGLTAMGRADIFATLRPKNEWDICAGTCLINEAGGEVINLNGQKITFNNRKTLIEPGLIAGYNLSVEKTYKIFNGN